MGFVVPSAARASPLLVLGKGGRKKGREGKRSEGKAPGRDATIREERALEGRDGDARGCWDWGRVEGVVRLALLDRRDKCADKQTDGTNAPMPVCFGRQTSVLRQFAEGSVEEQTDARERIYLAGDHEFWIVLWLVQC